MIDINNLEGTLDFLEVRGLEKLEQAKTDLKEVFPSLSNITFDFKINKENTDDYFEYLIDMEYKGSSIGVMKVFTTDSDVITSFVPNNVQVKHFVTFIDSLTKEDTYVETELGHMLEDICLHYVYDEMELMDNILFNERFEELTEAFNLYELNTQSILLED